MTMKYDGVFDGFPVGFYVSRKKKQLFYGKTIRALRMWLGYETNCEIGTQLYIGRLGGQWR